MNGGNFSLSSQNGGVIFANPTDTIRNAGGNIDISGASLSLGNLSTTGNFTTSGNVTLSASGNINAGDIIAAGNGYGSGNINVTSTSGGITLNQLNTSNNNGFTGGNVAGTVTLTAAGDILTNTINSSSNNGFSSGTGGAVIATTSDGNITTGAINSSATINTGEGSAAATGGDVTLQTTNAANSIIRFNSINSQAITDQGGAQPGITIQNGNVQVLTNGLVQGTGTGDTINTGGGTVTIQHDGGADNAPFIIGDVTVNGTAGSINAGEQLYLPVPIVIFQFCPMVDLFLLVLPSDYN